LENGHGDRAIDVLAQSDNDDDDDTDESDIEYEEVEDLDPDDMVSSILAPKHKLEWTA